MSVTIRPFVAGDVVQLALQPSQQTHLGSFRPFRNIEDGERLAAGGPAWTAIATGSGSGAGSGRIVACAGFLERWPAAERTGGHAEAWALLAVGIGAAHLAVTRYARARIADAPYSRLEALVRADLPAEAQLAALVGLELRARLDAWGPEGRPYLLFDRVREPARRRRAILAPAADLAAEALELA